jgi:Ca-activated chloride channel homolog
MNLIQLENGGFLFALFLIPLFVIIYILMRAWRKRALEKYGDMQLIGSLFPDVSIYKPVIKFMILLLSFTFLIFGIVNPQVGTKLSEFKREGVDVIIAIDVSNSMKAEDVKPDRLRRAKQAVSKLIDKLSDDRIGIVVFAGEAFLQLPLTSDYSAAKLMLNTIDTDIIPTQGTAIGAAIEEAIHGFKDDDNKSKCLIIITDGENHEDDAVGAATEAVKKGIIVHTIGMGTMGGGPIPIYSGGAVRGFLKDEEGNAIMTKMDPTMLQQIASAGNGKFITPGDGDPDLPKLLDEISKMEKKQYSAKLFTDYEDRFQYFIFAALILLLIEFFISEKKNKLIVSWNLFGEKRRFF